MKKSLILTGLSLALVSGIVYSQHPGGGQHKGMGMGMMDSTRHEHMQTHMKEHMMGQAGMPAMVATSDGGVVIRVGNRLYKYDKNLALKKEAEVKLDSAALHFCKGMMDH